MSFLPGFFPAIAAAIDYDFPVAAANTSGSDPSNTTSRAISVLSPAAGDLILVFPTYTAAPGTASMSGFTSFTNGFYKFATGSEGSTVNLTTTNSVQTFWLTYKITGANNINIGTAVQNTTVDPPSLSPVWGERNTLWFASLDISASSITSLTAPSGYTGTSIGTTVRSAAAWRAVRGATEDPATFTVSATGISFRSVQTISIVRL